MLGRLALDWTYHIYAFAGKIGRPGTTADPMIPDIRRRTTLFMSLERPDIPDYLRKWPHTEQNSLHLRLRRP